MSQFKDNKVSDSPTKLRIALLAGNLSLGGAEKQLVYIVKTLIAAGVDVQVYSLTKGEYYEDSLIKLGVPPIWVGKHQSPIFRLITFASYLHKFQPHIIQSIHFFTNLYTTICSPFFGAMPIGSIRGDTHIEMKANRYWSPILLHCPKSLIVNSCIAKDNAKQIGVKPEKIHLLFNVIDLIEHENRMSNQVSEAPIFRHPCALAVGRLTSEKRLDRFLTALARARKSNPHLQGMIIGEGPQLESLKLLAIHLGLHPDGIIFTGSRDDVPALMSRADIFVHTSDHEGFPNVILEAMAASLPVIATPAGEAKNLVIDGVTGYVVPYDDVGLLTDRIIALADSPQLRIQMGTSGLHEVQQKYNFKNFPNQLLTVYHDIAEQQKNRQVMMRLKM